MLIRLPPQMAISVRKQARESKVSANKFIIEAIQEKLLRVKP